MSATGRRAVFREVSDGVTVALRVAPRSGHNRIDGIVADADGSLALKVAVTAPPEDGKANDAVIALLAKAWRLPKGSLRVQQGATGRRKLLHVAGEPRTLLARLSATVDEGR